MTENAPTASRGESAPDNPITVQGTPLSHALQLVQQHGCYVHPLVPNGKDPLIDKRFGLLHGQDDASNDPEVVRDWLVNFPDANYGINLRLSGLTVPDLDQHPGQPDGVAAWRELAPPDEAPTFAVRTATGNGVHRYYERSPVPLVGKLKDENGRVLGIDLKHNGYVVGPGSIINGRTYEVISDAPVRPFPGWLAERGKKAEPAPMPSGPMAGEKATLARVRELRDELALEPWGGRNTAIARIAFMCGGYVGAGQISPEAVESILREVIDPWTAGHPRIRTRDVGTLRRQVAEGAQHPRPWIGLFDPGFREWTGGLVHLGVPRRTLPLVDWSALLNGDPEPPRWLAGDLFEQGQQVALVGSGKVGKSLLCQDWAVALINGRAWLGAEPRPPARVLYLDYENNLRQVRQNIESLGYTTADLDGFGYLSFPSFGALDTPRAVAEFLAAVDDFGPDVVFIDTVSRVISGKESDADTWLTFYRLALMPLKARDIAVVRLDHFGKDDKLGARGNSAKNQDVDHVFELKKVRSSRNDVTLRLRKTHTRTGLGREELMIIRHGEKDDERGWLFGKTSHRTESEAVYFDPEESKAVESLADSLDAAKVRNAREDIRRWLKDEKRTASNELLGKVIQLRTRREDEEETS